MEYRESSGSLTGSLRGLRRRLQELAGLLKAADLFAEPQPADLFAKVLSVTVKVALIESQGRKGHDSIIRA